MVPVVWIIMLLGRGKLVRMNVYICMCILYIYQIYNIFLYKYDIYVCFTNYMYFYAHYPLKNAKYSKRRSVSKSSIC